MFIVSASYCHGYERIQIVFGLETGFIDRFNTRLVLHLIIAPFSDFQALEITTAHAKCFGLLWFHQSFPRIAFQQWTFFSFRTHSVTYRLSTAPTPLQLTSKLVSFMAFRYRLRRKKQLLLYIKSELSAVGTYLFRGRYILTRLHVIIF